MAIDQNRSVGELAVERAARLPVFEDFGIDYCCSGDRSLAAACAAAGCEPDVVVAALERSDARAGGESAFDWRDETLAALIDHIVARHHAYLRERLPHLDDLLAKVQDAHGARHPELNDVARIFKGLRAELESHLAKEEQVLFPLIRALEAGDEPIAVRNGVLAQPIAVMEHEHDGAGEALRELRRLTGDHVAPADGCTSYAALMQGLDELERDLHEHIHKENNLLHPRALALVESRRDAS